VQLEVVGTEFFFLFESNNFSLLCLISCNFYFFKVELHIVEARFLCLSVACRVMLKEYVVEASTLILLYGNCNIFLQ